MLGDSLLLSAVSVLGFVGGLFGLMLVLAWLEHPEPPGWFRRRAQRHSARRASRQLAGGDSFQLRDDAAGELSDLDRL